MEGGGEQAEGGGRAEGDAEDVEGVQLAVTRAQYDTLSDNEIIKTARQTTSAVC